MNFTAENNLLLGLAQALENMAGAGVRFAPRGTAEPVNGWYSAHGTSVSFASPTNALKDPALAEVIPASSSISETTDAPKALTQTQQPDRVEYGKWQSRRLLLEDRLQVLDKEAKQVAVCTRCPQLVCSRSQTVYGVGNVTSRIIFVGEGPGAEEDRQGIPFVGAAGQLLDKIISAMNLRREDVYIMNAVKCRPQNNRTPTDDEIANCQPYFLKQLETIQPEFIVCLGAVASRAVLQTTLGIGRLRGKFHSFRGAKVAVTYHPAYLLRTPEAKKLTWDDMKMVMAEMKL